MAGGDETRDDRWGDTVARKTFILTVVCAVLFVGAISVFVLSTNVGR